MIWNLNAEERTTALFTLRGARRLIEDEGRWTCGAYARNAQNQVTTLASLDGLGEWSCNDCKWCLTGALWVAATDLRRDILSIWDLARLLYRGLPGTSDEGARAMAPMSPKRAIIHLQNYNDVDLTTHADVVAVYDRAIAALEAKA